MSIRSAYSEHCDHCGKMITERIDGVETVKITCIDLPCEIIEYKDGSRKRHCLKGKFCSVDCLCRYLKENFNES